MKTLEGIFRKGWKQFARLNVDGKSTFVPIDNTSLFFKESVNGDFFHITDNNLKYTAELMNSSDNKKAKEECEILNKKFSVISSKVLYAHKFWKEGNRADINIWYLDIEAIDLNNRSFPDTFNPVIPITHIQILDKRSDSILIFQTKDIAEGEKKKLKIKYKDDCKNLIFKHIEDETEMLKTFIKFLNNVNPTVIVGWNAETFDFPYITARAEYLGIDINTFSPLEKTSFQELNQFGKKQRKVEWVGIYLIDLMESFKKFTFKDQKSYSLEYISKVILKKGSGKIDYGEHKSIHNFFKNDYVGFVDYAVMDVVVLRNIDIKVGLLSLIQTMAEMMGCNYNEVFGTVAPWTILLTHLALEKRMVLPPESEYSDHRPIEGGFVKHPIFGLLEWLFSYDYNSLYPSIQVSFNLSPDTYIKEKDLPPEAIAFLRKVNEKEGIFLEDLSLFDEVGVICKRYNIEFSGLGFFKRDKQGILPEILEKFYYDRKAEKQKMLLADAILSGGQK
jgi:DNA polymerase elongation subunit (family B)